MAEEMSSSAWVLMDDDCDCGGPPPNFHLPPPPVPPDLPCELLDMTCSGQLNVADAEFKKIGTFPSVAVIICSTLLSAVIILVIGVVIWRKRRKGVTQSKDFDHHHHHHGLGPTMVNGNGLLYEDLAHARPRPPISVPQIEMLDVNHHGISSQGLMGNQKLDLSYFLNSPPIYEELPDLDGGGGSHSDRNNGPSEDEFAEDELSVIDVPINHCHPGGVMDGGINSNGDHDLSSANSNSRYPNSATATANRNLKSSRGQSLNRKRNARNPTGTQSLFKSQRSLDRRNRANGNNTNYPGTNPRSYFPGVNRQQQPPGSGMLILSDHTTGMTMKIPPHLFAVLTESALCNGGGVGSPGRGPYEVISTGGPGLVHPGTNLMMNGQPNGIYPSSRSSGSSYGDGSSSSSTRINPNGNSVESSSFDSGIGQHSTNSCINSPAYDQTVLSPHYSMNPYDYATTNPGGMGLSNGHGGTPTQFLTSQHPNFRRLRMTTSDRDHPLYSNHLLN